MRSPALGAYVLPGDPTWLRTSLGRYYDRLSDLVVPVPSDGLSWTGRPLPVQECLQIITGLDTRGIVRQISGQWTDPRDPVAAELAQRQAALDAMTAVDWVLQVDNDELLPDLAGLLDVLVMAEERGIAAVEWPMRVIFRALRSGTFLEVVAADGQPRFDYPGPIAVRSGVRLIDCRRAVGDYLRPVVVGDSRSLQVTRRCEVDEHRVECLTAEQAIIHNSWGREPTAIRRKMASSAHQEGLRSLVYFWLVWRASPLTWRWLRDFHLLSGSLWPRLGRLDRGLTVLVDAQDRHR